MRKTFYSACFPAFWKPAARSGLRILFFSALLLASGLQGQTLQRWEDEFLNRSKIERLQNATIDTVQGLISLTPIREEDTQGQNFRAALSGIDKLFVEPTRILDLPLNPVTVVDIDTVPGNEDVYLVTDQISRRVFLYNAAIGRVVNPDLGSGKGLITPQDAFPFIEGNNVLKALITDSEIDQVLKVNSTNNQLEWFFQSGLLNPSDAVLVPGSGEVLICDSGNNRIIAVDTTTDAITWQFGNGAGSGIFNNPVDVDVDPISIGRYLVTDQNRHRIVLVDRASSSIVFQFGSTDSSGLSPRTLTFPADADPLPNGNILIADAGNNRLIEVNRQGEIVWQFAHAVANIRDADRIFSGTHRDKTIAALKDSAAATNVTAKRFVYQNEVFASNPRDFGQPVDFDSLRFTADVPSETSVRLQLRTVENLSDTSNAQWFGPTSTNDFYTASPAAINPVHDGDRFYQFRAFLETANRLKTPELTSVEVKATFFRADTQGVVLSKAVRDSANAIITSWRSLQFTKELPSALDNTIAVDILDSAGTTVLATYQATQGPTNQHNIDPDNVPSLKGRQSLRLRGRLRTTSAFVSPKLLSWVVTWNSVKLGPSQTNFVNAGGAPAPSYRVKSTPGDSAYLQVVDPNVLALLDSIQVDVRSALAGDSERLSLRIDPTTRSFFRNRNGLRLVLAGQSTTGNNGLLEVRDRDTLRVTYVDPFDAADRSSATALIIQNARGSIQIERVSGVKADSVAINEFVHVRVIGETDRNLSPTGRDTVFADLFDARTTDNEKLVLVEVANGAGQFNTGDFRTTKAIKLISTGSPPGDDTLYVQPGDLITASYTDSIANEQPIQAFARVTGDLVDILGSGEKFTIEIAPNPYRTGSAGPIKLRAQVNTGQLTLQRAEIFNIAGERVKTIPAGQIIFGITSTISASEGAVVAMDWWNVQGDDNRPVASGTYFAKFHVTLSEAGSVNQVTAIRKLVILQQ